MSRDRRRLERQFGVFERWVPMLRGPISALQKNRWRMFRIPFAVLLILGSVVSFLPVLGLWMLPVGLLLLAIDIPMLRPSVNAFIIRGRRRAELWRRWLRAKWR